MMTRRSIVARAAALAVLPFTAIAEASAPDAELPPLPTPDMPPGEIIRALIAWIGDEDALIEELRGGVISAVEQHCDDDNDDESRIRELLEAVDCRPLDDDGHGEKIRRAIVRHGYNRLPLPEWLVESRASRAARSAEPKTEPEPPPDPDIEWSLKQVNALARQYIDSDSSQAIGGLNLADVLTATYVVAEGRAFQDEAEALAWTEERAEVLGRVEEIRLEARRRLEAQEAASDDDQTDD